MQQLECTRSAISLHDDVVTRIVVHFNHSRAVKRTQRSFGNNILCKIQNLFVFVELSDDLIFIFKWVMSWVLGVKVKPV
ncbi:hypothetical protein MY55_00040 [Chromobacterium subtsugae]|nr:hypothetical protein MY55_00040 [Chromobacterium subtsugae]